MTLLDLIDGAVRDRQDAVALDGPAVPGGPRTYGTLVEHAARRAGELARRGVRPGDRVAMLSENRAEVAELLIACWRLGACVVPLNTRHTPRELALVLDDARPRLLVVDEEHEPAARRALDAAPGAALVPLDGSVEGRIAGPQAAPVATDAALLLYTSGTTGRSKGALLSHGNVVATIAALIAAWRIVPEDRLLLTLPLFHTHGLVVGLLTTLAAGGTVALHRRFDAGEIARALGAGEASLFYGVPTLYVRLVEALRERGAAFPARVRLCCSGSAPLAPETFGAFRELTGLEILERYGMTETGMTLSNPYAGPRLPGTVGRPLPGVSIRIVGEDGTDVSDGADGELLVAGPNVFGGYLGDERKTRESFVVDGQGGRWFRTGDLARRDPATGHVTLLGRRHELIISGGFNVYPREVEDVLAAHPRVAEVAVCGVPDPEWGERVVAFVVGRGAISARELAAWARERLAGYKVPRRFVPLASLPRNAMGKIDRRALVREAGADGTPEEG
ncbi:MAG: long-chain fatty acid--CoA ligase [Acidobacteria bacterium]|nr:MAG: long-chain fatty acid--CoA ligase [Acidobacteriota bacterium]